MTCETCKFHSENNKCNAFFVCESKEWVGKYNDSTDRWQKKYRLKNRKDAKEHFLLKYALSKLNDTHYLLNRKYFDSAICHNCLNRKICIDYNHNSQIDICTQFSGNDTDVKKFLKNIVEK